MLLSVVCKIPKICQEEAVLEPYCSECLFINICVSEHKTILEFLASVLTRVWLLKLHSSS